MLCLRSDVNRRGANTTGHGEGFHKFLKALADTLSGCGRRLDRLIYFLLGEVQEHFIARDTLVRRGVSMSYECNTNAICASYMHKKS